MAKTNVTKPKKKIKPKKESKQKKEVKSKKVNVCNKNDCKCPPHNCTYTYVLYITLYSNSTETFLYVTVWCTYAPRPYQIQ